jgi:hypothetical protein
MIEAEAVENESCYETFKKIREACYPVRCQGNQICAGMGTKA